MKFTMTLTLAALGLSMSGSALAIDYSRKDCTNGADCNLPGMLVSALSGGTQAEAKALCGTQVYGDTRCHQNTQAKAEEICSKYPECTAIVQDTVGYEPRSGDIINHHPAAKRMWQKILDPNGYSHTDCTNGGDCNLPGMLVTALSAGAQAQAKELCGTQVYGDERCHQKHQS